MEHAVCAVEGGEPGIAAEVVGGAIDDDRRMVSRSVRAAVIVVTRSDDGPLEVVPAVPTPAWCVAVLAGGKGEILCGKNGVDVPFDFLINDLIGMYVERNVHPPIFGKISTGHEIVADLLGGGGAAKQHCKYEQQEKTCRIAISNKHFHPP